MTHTSPNRAGVAAAPSAPGRGSLPGLALAVLLCAPAASIRASDQAPKPAADHPAPVPVAHETNAPSPPEIDAALRTSREHLATTNLTSSKVDAEEQARLAKFPALIEEARNLRSAKQPDAAEKILARVLSSTAPAEFHRTALLEMALVAQDRRQFSTAQQILAQYLTKYPTDPSVPEVLLRQGLIYRQMGAPTLAVAKFYGVMTTALNLQLDRVDYYQRLVLHAQTEIADTHYLQGKYEEAAEFFGRLLKLDAAELNKPQILYKLVRSLAYLGRSNEVATQARTFLSRHPEHNDLPEVRFLLAEALKKMGRNREAMQEVLTLLQSQQKAAGQNPANWAYWQQRTGNDIANQLYKEGDYVNALEIYLNLASLSDAPAWQLPVWYQIGLVYERLLQPQKAGETYGRILARQKDLGTNAPAASPSLNAVLEMAKWRRDFLKWQADADQSNQQYTPKPAPLPPAEPQLSAASK